ncbi:MAG: PDZ domain-containing protein [Planctomycetaceae bacterium]|nr:PDZ domain-containing protein [Planctomycetaceae bacterium]
MVLFLLLTCNPGHTAAGPDVPVIADASPEAIEAVRSGVYLEQTRQWLDAIEHYENALETFADSRELKYGLRRAKIHFAIERRYADRSFETRLVSRTRQEALQLLDDLLRHVQSSYVDSVSETSFIAHGTESLYLALANEKFLSRNAPNASRDRIQQVRQILRQDYWNRPIQPPETARSVVSTVCDLIRRDLDIRDGAVIMEYVFGGCNALDDYSSYLTPDRLEDLYGNIEGEFVGLGIEMKSELGKGLLMVNVLPDSPAEEGGILPGDHIVAINGTDCRSMSTDEAARLLRGPSGSQVQLQIDSPDSEETREGTFSRRAVQVKSIPVAEIIDEDAGIGYIQLTGFQKTSAQELDAALASLSQRGMRALIWDVRGNPGGLLTAAVEVLDRFIPEGVLVSTRGRTRDQNWSYSAHRSGTWDIPLVLLIDGDSASASEIVAGAVGDHRRGVIVGRKSYGKWSVQSIFPVRDATGLRLTTAKFYSPKGRTLSKIGVRPDIVVERTNDQMTAYRGTVKQRLAADADVLKGLEVLQSRLTQR